MSGKERELLESAKLDKWDEVKSLLNEGISPTGYTCWTGHTALAYIAWNGNLYLLLESSPSVYNIDVTDMNLKTPLHYAVMHGKAANVNFLINRGCDSNIKDKNGDTALHLAARNAYYDIVKTLLENGALLNVQNDK